MKNWLLAGCFVFTVVWLSLFVIALPPSAPQLPGGEALGNLQSIDDGSRVLELFPLDVMVAVGLLLFAGVLLNLFPVTLPERYFFRPDWSYDGLVGSFVWLLTAMGAGYSASKLLAHYVQDSFYFHWWASLVLQLTLLGSVLLLVKTFGEDIHRESWTDVDDWLGALTHGTLEYVRIYPLLFFTLILNQILIIQLDYSAAPASYLFILTADTWPKILQLFALTCLLAPLAEELFFRGVVYRSLRDVLSRRGAALIAAVVFAFVHFEIQFFVPLVVLGYFLCVIFEKSGSIKVVITMHFLQNTISLLIFHRLL